MGFQDFREVLTSGQVDLIYGDPPWNYGNGITHAKQKELINYETLLFKDWQDFFPLAYDALYKDRNLWLWSDAKTLEVLFPLAKEAGFTFRQMFVVKRRNFGLGYFARNNVYYLPVWIKGKGWYNKDVAKRLPTFLGEHICWRSKKPQAVLDIILSHSLPPASAIGREPIWVDPFPATHTEKYRKKDENYHARTA